MCNAKMTRSNQAEGPHTDGIDPRQHASLPCGLQQQKRGHRRAQEEWIIYRKEVRKHRSEKGESVVQLNPSE